MIPLRDETPTRIYPFVTLSLVILNVAIFLLEFVMGDNVNVLFYRFGMIPARLANNWTDPGTLMTLFTSMFLHGGWAHLIGNMVYLWIFGDNIEDRMGHVRFILVYLCAGVAASLVEVFVDPTVNIPTVGASGAIAGVLGAYFILYPRSRITTLIFFGFFIRLIKMPALFVLGLWIIFQLFYGLSNLSLSEANSGVAYFAHIGGFIGGMILIKLFRHQRKEQSFI